ncbi:MAG: PEP/pyruvate-binding domain-containing protein [Candidatus Neomarinimicrobiota bacterium]|nr:PEP/pyruvate-binding domain-containing protein [Candidatus Neomarinimicrobiota bacterium]
MNRSEATTSYRWNYHDLMLHRVHEILLVASPYDAYILEEDGRLTEQILTEYLGMNLSYAPRVWRASTAAEAMNMLEERNFDLILTMLRISDMDPITFGKRVKKDRPELPVILLVFDATELKRMGNLLRGSAIDKVFVWSGDANVLPVIIKYVEDRKNVERDMEMGDIRTIVVVEDSPRFYSIILPRIYRQVVHQTTRLMDESLNDTHRLLRLRARPKIILASTYEEATEMVKMCGDNLLGVISDVRFPRNGDMDISAGFKLGRWIRNRESAMPLLLQSTKPAGENRAKRLDARFLYKESPTFLKDMSDFIEENFGFGDFVFRLAGGKEVARAPTLKDMEKVLSEVPAKSIAYHAGSNHFSNWLATRGEFWIASKVRKMSLSDFDSVEALRKYLIEAVGTTREARVHGRVIQYRGGGFDKSADFVRFGRGSLGGKARGLAFAQSLIKTDTMKEKFPGINITIPKIAVIGTDQFEIFMDENQLWGPSLKSKSSRRLAKKFLSSPLPKALLEFLREYLREMKNPVAVRSSGLFEDMQYQSLAGLYATYMLPNSDRSLKVRVSQAADAIRLVYASMFTVEVKSVTLSSGHRLEDERMGVIIQEIAGKRHGPRYYPTFSGVAQSINYYPVSYMEREEGASYLALGLGRTIAEGGRSLRISPKYPRLTPQFYSPEAMLENSQTQFYALALTAGQNLLNSGEEGNLVREPLSIAEEDGELKHLASVVAAPDNIVRDSLNYDGPRVVTFSRMLKSKQFPLTELIEEVLRLSQNAMGCAIEAEFACNFSDNPEEPSEFSFLQIRPMPSDTFDRAVDMKASLRGDVVCSSEFALGNGYINDIKDILMVDPDGFNFSDSAKVANEIGRINRQMGNVNSIIIGPGRWGSADPWLGIPVRWDQISRARVILEVGLEGKAIDPSFGSHFFQNVTSFRIGYFTVNGPKDTLDWSWLRSLPTRKKSDHLRWIRLKEPLAVWIDGLTGKGLILKRRLI